MNQSHTHTHTHEPRNHINGYASLEKFESVGKDMNYIQCQYLLDNNQGFVGKF